MAIPPNPSDLAARRAIHAIALALLMLGLAACNTDGGASYSDGPFRFKRDRDGVPHWVEDPSTARSVVPEPWIVGYGVCDASMREADQRARDVARATLREALVATLAEIGGHALATPAALIDPTRSLDDQPLTELERAGQAAEAAMVAMEAVVATVDSDTLPELQPLDRYTDAFTFLALWGISLDALLERLGREAKVGRERASVALHAAGLGLDGSEEDEEEDEEEDGNTDDHPDNDSPEVDDADPPAIRPIVREIDARLRALGGLRAAALAALVDLWRDPGDEVTRRLQLRQLREYTHCVLAASTLLSIVRVDVSPAVVDARPRELLAEPIALRVGVQARDRFEPMARFPIDVDVVGGQAMLDFPSRLGDDGSALGNLRPLVGDSEGRVIVEVSIALDRLVPAALAETLHRPTARVVVYLPVARPIHVRLEIDELLHDDLGATDYVASALADWIERQGMTVEIVGADNSERIKPDATDVTSRRRPVVCVVRGEVWATFELLDEQRQRSLAYVEATFDVARLEDQPPGDGPPAVESAIGSLATNGTFAYSAREPGALSMASFRACLAAVQHRPFQTKLMALFKQAQAEAKSPR